MKKIILPALIVVLLTAACKKSSFEDSGVNDPRFNGTIMEYLESDPLYFDTLVRVVKYAGLEETLRKENLTFFAPPDPCFKKILDAVNDYQLTLGADSVTRFEQVKPEVWKQFLDIYLFPGNRGLKDYTQVDTLALDTYKGALFESVNTTPMNIGVIYNDAVSGDPNTVGGSTIIKYKGYRQLMLSYVPDEAFPYSNWINAVVAASDIAPTNGRVHRLRYMTHIFGFDPFRFIQAARERGIDYTKQ
ncbi:fasciclin domain-containing protein [Niabella beijingensis]|uniref:fasciclin domain-containing protein n=1 Tax=Niabella beijingensis TaxID=2872700 RepID=UPI001CBD0EAB|nr:fasciclin domain-containing protein [Niabella beijingensis]MBZ4188304.1 fasciclin domain-containing protein [Niabella beijingensis]